MARSIWTGSISFGLVNIPVKIFSAIREHDVHFHQIAPDGSRVHNERVSGKSGKTVDFKDIRKGYETSKGKYVIFERDELKELAPTATKTIDIEDFVPLDEIDPIHFERTYYVAPANDAAKKAYALLTAVMEERERIGIGTVIMRERQHLAAVRPYGKGLALSTLLFADEVVPQSDVPDIPSRRPTLSRARRSWRRRSSTRSSTPGTRSGTTTTTRSSSARSSTRRRRARCSRPRRRSRPRRSST